MRERLGVTVGKFYPPHLGHAHLIAAAQSQCDRLVVIVADHPEQSIRGEVRAAWIQEAFPEVEVIVTPDDLPEESEPWGQRTVSVLGRAPDVAFTSEAYGETWARAMGCPSHVVDLSRSTVPVSGTQVRANLASRFSQLMPPARRDLAMNVVALGAESSGTTTLALSLAAQLETVCVPEYGREYWVERERDHPGVPWTTADFVHIATEHHDRGSTVALGSTGVTVWDTDALATGVWHRRYLGEGSDEVEAVAGAHRPHLYVLTAPDFPFVQDGTREDGPHREQMHAWFREALAASGVPWIEVSGSHEDRMAAALAAVDALPRPRLV